MVVRFTWDPAKSRANVRKHRIAFVDAARIFDGPTVERTDDRFAYGERRVYAIGLVGLLEVTVVYADLGDDRCHIISAWRAAPHERRYFWQHIDE
jgi:uncharacterized DUF497 family protein